MAVCPNSSYIGLALLKTGNKTKALPYLNTALDLFRKMIVVHVRGKRYLLKHRISL